jgi:hypothetical protein
VAAILLILLVSADAAPTYYWRVQPVGEPAFREPAQDGRERLGIAHNGQQTGLCAWRAPQRAAGSSPCLGAPVRVLCATAQLLTLLCHGCSSGDALDQDAPLVAVLRDTLGDADNAAHKISAVWLLTYSHPTYSQKALAAIPFFYWAPSDGRAKIGEKDVTPLLDLSAPQHPAVSNVERQILQWTALDTIAVPVRATSRAYRTNELDHERLHLEEANSYLLQAPTGDESVALTPEERDIVMERLELRKKLLGGFVNTSRAASLGKEAGFEQERVRVRNWELLRQCAETVGLVFEPVTISGEYEQYGMLWYPARAVHEPGGSNLAPIWKVLNIRDPYSDDRVKNWTGLTARRDVDSNGTVLRAGGSGVRTINLIPLGLYSLTYPRQPLLLVDFRDKTHVRRHDVTQKSIDEIASGVVGLSHFTNWYYFLGSDIYTFFQERRGKATNRAERLDSYSEFRVALALDRDLDPKLREELQQRIDTLSTNPLETSARNEMKAAVARYELLTAEASNQDSRLIKLIENQRGEELAAFGSSPHRKGLDVAFHALTLGKYTHRAKKDEDNEAFLAVYRRADYHLNFLDKLVAAGTPPEVAFNETRIRTSVDDLSTLMRSIDSKQMRTHAADTLERLSQISDDTALQADCRAAHRQLLAEKGLLSPTRVPGISVSPAILP